LAPPNIVIVVFDAMRRDALRAYGGHAPTPHLDSFSAEGVVYQDCIAPSPWTIPSHASLFTGAFPSQHGVHETYERSLAETLGLMEGVTAPTLAEILKERGYQTVGMPANATLTLREGFGRGFDSFRAFEKRLVTPEELALIRRASEKGRGRTAIALDMAAHGKFRELFRLYSVYRRMRKEGKLADFPRSKGGNFLVDHLTKTPLEPPFFLFVNFMETHEPYLRFEQLRSNLGPFNSVHQADLYGYKEVTESQVQSLRPAYSAAVSRADEYFGSLVSVLKSRGLYDGSLVIATSDHGQEFKEEGFYTHGNFLHDEILEIPLIVKYPGGRKPPAGEGYRNLCGVFSLATEAAASGEAAMLGGQETFAESFGAVHKPPEVRDPALEAKLTEARKRIDRPLKAVYRDGYKMVVDWNTKSVEELSLRGKPLDPREEKAVVEGLLVRLEDFAQRGVHAAPSSRPMTQSEEEEVSRRLKDLGYL
jgi:arylsulfatase A-like enzyme